MKTCRNLDSQTAGDVWEETTSVRRTATIESILHPLGVPHPHVGSTGCPTVQGHTGVHPTGDDDALLSRSAIITIHRIRCQ